MKPFREKIFIHLNVVSLLLMRLYPDAFFYKLLHLIISTDKPNTGMAFDSPYVIFYFLVYIIFKILIQIIDGTGKHKVLPNNKSQLVTYIIELISREESPSPYSYGIKVRRFAVF